ncbi:MAG TPA: efflux RND transporter periplasmic adaptor subunit [Acidobacteriota bacterium]|nr:efflux RND transporter periplasmic adaptor subunit [Acidobacteriota bacterium]
MKKIVLISLLTFAAGVGLTFVILANPWHWHWVHAVQERLPMAHQMPESEDEKGQLWTCGMHPQVIREEPGNCPICQMPLTPVKGQPAPAAGSADSGERKILYWRAPMDPTYTSDKPGKSPMGMDLVPVYEGEEESTAPGTVRIDPTFVQNIGVQSVEARRGDIPYEIRTVGTFTYDDRQMHWVTTKYEGWIERAEVNYVGEAVSKGQVLFEIYSPQLVTTQKEYLQALRYAARFEDENYPEVRQRAQSLVESSRQRLAYWDISPEQIEQLTRSGEVQRALKVHSPVNGLVVSKMAQALEGMYVKPGMNLYQLVDLSTIWVEAEIFEHQVPWLKPGQSATVETPYQPGRTHRGRVRYVFPFFNERTRTLKVSLELPNPRGELRSDMYADVIFDVPSARNVVTVPEEAVIHSGQRNVVVLDRGGGTFQVSEVQLGRNGNGLWEVVDGVEEGDRVVISSQFLIDSESNLREAIQKLTSRGASEADMGTGAPMEHQGGQPMEEQPSQPMEQQH